MRAGGLVRVQLDARRKIGAERGGGIVLVAGREEAQRAVEAADPDFAGTRLAMPAFALVPRVVRCLQSPLGYYVLPSS